MSIVVDSKFANEPRKKGAQGVREKRCEGVVGPWGALWFWFSLFTHHNKPTK
jgi:hypothetical protein